MQAEEVSPYLPKNKRIHYFHAFKTSVAFRVWKRMLERYGGFNKNTNFKLLDVGCGAGYFLSCIERWFTDCEICGLDIDKDLLDFARGHVKKAKLILGNAQELPFPSNSLDVVSSIHVIEHLEDPLSFFAEANKILKSDGLLIIATPNPAGTTAKILKSRWPGYRYDHISLKTPRQWREIIDRSGFEILQDGSTALTGFKTLQKLPFALVNWIPRAIFGFFPWYKGESYMAIAKKNAQVI